MKIRQVKAFLAVVKTGGVRAAARRLCLTQSAVAKAIAQLESELGAALFERTAEGMRLNDVGRSLLPYAETIAANADGAAAAVAACVAGRDTTLRLCITPTLPPTVLADAIARFRPAFPKVQLEFSSGFLHESLPKILADKIDLALAMVGAHQRSALTNLVEEPLFEVEHGVVAKPTHRVFEEGAELARVFEGSEWLTTRQDVSFLLARLAEAGAGAPAALTLCDFFAIDALNGRADALSLSPLSVVDDARYSERVRALSPERFPLPRLSVSFFRRKGVQPCAAAQHMKHALREAFAHWYAQKPRRYVTPVAQR